MPRPDPLPRFNPRKPNKLYDALDLRQYEIDEMRARIREAERRAQTAIRECEAMLRAKLQSVMKKPKRKPPEAGIAVPAVPPKGPLPKQGGAEAPLEFD